MKKILIIAFIAAGIAIVSCNGVKKEPGRVYIPDMMYSRAYETYSLTEEHRKELEKQGIHYSGIPVPGTIKRGIDFSFRLTKDIGTDSSQALASRQIKNPLTTLDSSQMKEAERLYLIHCGICHGAALDGNGPLYNNGDGPYPAKPANLSGDPKYTQMPEGQIYYAITYGKNLMGSYASQLDANQRWMVVAFIKNRQSKPATAAAGTADVTKTGAGGNTDSTKAQ